MAIGSYWSSRVWEPIVYRSVRGTPRHVFADTTTPIAKEQRVDNSAAEAYPIYLNKGFLGSWQVSLVCSGIFPALMAYLLCYSPVTGLQLQLDSWQIAAIAVAAAFWYPALTIVWHLVRACVLVQYVFIRTLIVDRILSCMGEDSAQLAADRLKELGEVDMSFKTAIKSPYFGVRHAWAHLKVLFDPSRFKWGESIEGRMDVVNVENQWGRYIPFSQSFWSVGGRQADFKWRMGGFSSVLAGCYQAPGYVLKQGDGFTEVFLWNQKKYAVVQQPSNSSKLQEMAPC